jgi:hypothetical protein
MKRIITKQDIAALGIALLIIIFPAVGVAIVDKIAELLTK